MERRVKNKKPAHVAWRVSKKEDDPITINLLEPPGMP
jgi:hypothetical protein